MGQNSEKMTRELVDCGKKADNLYDFWHSTGSFPSFWSLIDNDREKLQSIFLFFCEMKMLQLKDDTVSVRECLSQRLRARFTGDAAPFPCALKDQIESLSRTQAAAIRELEAKNLVGPAFSLFVSGSLTIKPGQYMTKSVLDRETDSDGEYPEPDSGAFFFWAEFGLLSSYFGFEADTWRRTLPVLLRAERIYAACYGQPKNGIIPPDRVFDDYRASVKFNAIHPKEAERVEASSSSRLDELEVQATASARFAFPGEFKLGGQ